MELLKLMTKLETEVGFEDMLKSTHVDIIPCQAFQLEALDKKAEQGFLTIDGEAIEGGCIGPRMKIYGEVVEKVLPIIYG